SSTSAASTRSTARSGGKTTTSSCCCAADGTRYGRISPPGERLQRELVIAAQAGDSWLVRRR
ncbi:MAG TPA: hypothetical protein VFO83_11020, partial [Aggregicoccus sp.]|nr:hypothetical protein [Aggregicoccus sp.]